MSHDEQPVDGVDRPDDDRPDDVLLHELAGDDRPGDDRPDDDRPDDVLLHELAGAVAAGDAVSDRAREAARAAYTWRTIDEELLELAHDSSTSEEVLVRSTATTRVIGFSGRGLSLEVELDSGRVMGQVVPARECTVSIIVGSDDAIAVQTDESGIFDLSLDAGGPVRFTVDVDGETRRTVWITL